MKITVLLSWLPILGLLPMLPACIDADGSSQDAGLDASSAEGVARWRQIADATGASLLGFAVGDDGTADALYRDNDGVWLTSVCDDQVKAHETGLEIEAGDSLVELERDGAGTVHLVWADTSDVVHHASIADGNAAMPEIVSDEGTVPRLAVTGGGEVHVVYAAGDVIHATPDGSGGWRKEVAVAALDEGIGVNHPDVGVVDGEPVVSFLRMGNASNEEIALARRDAAGTWTTSTVGVPAMFVWTTFLEVASDNTLVVAATTAEAGTTWWTDDGSGFRTVATVGEREATSFALDGDDQPMVVHPHRNRTGGNGIVEDRVLRLYRHADGSHQAIADSCPVLVDAAPGGDPVLALGCGDVMLWMPDGTYPADWVERCAAVAKTLCDVAETTCGTNCFGTMCDGTSCNRSSCSGDCMAGRLEMLCGNATVTPEELAACANAANEGVCVDSDGESVYGLTTECELSPLPR